MLKATLLICLCSVLALPQLVQAEENRAGASAHPKGQEEMVYVSKGYRYEAADHEKNSDAGLFLCGTRCNALSVDYLNITTPGGWRMLRTQKDHEVNIKLDAFGLNGTCTCVVDEYKVIVNNIYMSK